MKKVEKEKRKKGNLAKKKRKTQKQMKKQKLKNCRQIVLKKHAPSFGTSDEVRKGSARTERKFLQLETLRRISHDVRRPCRLR